MKPTTRNLTNILKAKPGQIIPITAQFSAIPPVKKAPLIKPKAGPEKYDGKDRVEVEHWLSFCAIGTQIIDTGTKMLAHKGLINGRDAVFDLIAAFKQLNKHFTGNENYDRKQMGIEDFVFSFLTGDEEHQKRVIKFQESILNKKS